MKFVKETRRGFYFSLENNDRYLNQDGIKVIDNQIMFPRYYPDPQGFAAYEKINKDHKGMKTFATADECEKYYNHSESEGVKMEFVSGKKQYKRLYEVQTKAVEEISDDDWQLIEKRMRRKGHFEKSDIRVFEDRLANNWRDRDGERFSYGILKAFDMTIPGKSRLIGHSRSGPGKGRYFKSKLGFVSIEEAIEIMMENAERSGLKSLLKQVEDRDGKLVVLEPSFYVLISDDTKIMIDEMDAGIGGDSSIGFRADKLEPVKNDQGAVLYYEYIDEGHSEAVEGSDVWLGAQRGMGVRKSADEEEEYDEILTIKDAIGEKPFENEHSCRIKEPGQYEKFARKNCEQKHEGKCIDVIYGIRNGKSEIQALRYKKDVWNAKDASTHCKSRGGTFEAAKEADQSLVVEKEKDNKQVNGGQTKMKFIIESIGFDREVKDLTEDSVLAIQDSIVEKVDAKIGELETSIGSKDTEIETLNKTITDNAPRLEVANEYEESLKKKIIDLSVFLKQTENDDVKMAEQRTILDVLTVVQLKGQVEKLEKQVNEKYPSYGILPSNTESLGSSDEPKQTTVLNQHRYQAPSR